MDQMKAIDSYFINKEFNDHSVVLEDEGEKYLIIGLILDKSYGGNISDFTLKISVFIICLQLSSDIVGAEKLLRL